MNEGKLASVRLMTPICMTLSLLAWIIAGVSAGGNSYSEVTAFAIPLLSSVYDTRGPQILVDVRMTQRAF